MSGPSGARNRRPRRYRKWPARRLGALDAFDALDSPPASPPAAEQVPSTGPLAAASAAATLTLTPASPAAAAVVPELIPLTALAPAIREASVSRRWFLGFGLSVVGGLTGAGVLSRFFPVFADAATDPSPIVPNYDPARNRWTFVVDTTSCIGCGLCVVACKEENHVTESPEFSRTWVERHAIAADGTVYVDSPGGGADGFPPTSVAPGAAEATIESAFFEPRLCMQCEDSPCTTVCPVGATYRTAEGIVLVDASRCIGCGYCVLACPYGARYIAPAADRAPNGTPGVADKCTWCYHRITRGDQPACVEVCPVGARKFGDADDPSSEVATLIRQRNGKPLHPEFGTRPRVMYLGPAAQEA